MKPKRNAFIAAARRTPARVCPACQRVVDAVTDVGLDRPSARKPQPGDLTICAYCCALLAFTETALRLATQAEFEILDPALQRLVHAKLLR